MSQKQTEVSGSPIASMQAIWTEHVASVSSVATTWANTRGQYDPNWEHKRHLVADAMAAIISAEGYPLSHDQTISLVEKAIDRVNFRLRLLGL